MDTAKFDGNLSQELIDSAKDLSKAEKIAKVENNSQFSIGDIVYLKSGGPPMTITSFYAQTLYGDVGCIWFQFSELKHLCTHSSCLTDKNPNE